MTTTTNEPADAPTPFTNRPERAFRRGAQHFEKKVQILHPHHLDAADESHPKKSGGKAVWPGCGGHAHERQQAPAGTGGGDNIVDSDDDDDGEVVSKLRRLTVKRPKLHRGLKENKYNYKSNHNWSSSIKHYDRQYPRSPLRATPRLILGNNDGEDDEDNTPKPRLRGLRNLGNTCYQNASLQMLYTCRGFMASLQRQCHQAGGDLDLTGALCRVDSDLQRPSTFFPANPAPVKEAMDRKTDKFVGYEQRDAHEFLSDLVDCVHEELEAGSRSSSNNNEAAPKPKYPTDDFCLTVQVCLKCLSCGYSR